MDYEGFNLRGLVTPKFSAPSSGETMRQAPEGFSRCKNLLEVLYHHAKFGGARISPAAGAAKNVEFLCVFVPHAFERQSLCARFRHEGVNDFDALVCSCAPVFNFIRLSAVLLATPQNAEVQKNGNTWVLSLPEGDRINRSRRNLHGT